MQDASLYMTIAAASLLAITIVSITALRGWNEWISYKRLELREIQDYRVQNEGNGPSATSRIEMADLKERLKKLEAIAAGVEF